MKLTEGDKTRFLRPMFDNYNTNGTILFDELVKWVNEVGQNKFTYNWLDKDKENLFNTIVNDFERYKAEGGSRKERKRDVISYTESHGLKYLAESDKYIFFWVPSYEAAKWCDSFDCCGFGGKWCIGWKQSDQYWQSYTGRGDKFILAINKRPLNAQDGKCMIELAPIGATGGSRPQVWFQTDKPNETMPWNKWKQSLGFSYPELRKLVQRAEAGENLREEAIPVRSNRREFYEDVYSELRKEINETLKGMFKKPVLMEKGMFIKQVKENVDGYLNEGNTARDTYFNTEFNKLVVEAEDFFIERNRRLKG